MLLPVLSGFLSLEKVDFSQMFKPKKNFLPVLPGFTSFFFFEEKNYVVGCIVFILAVLWKSFLTAEFSLSGRPLWSSRQKSVLQILLIQVIRNVATGQCPDLLRPGELAAPPCDDKNGSSFRSLHLRCLSS